MNISANELKTRGALAIEEALTTETIATITVRGRRAYIVTTMNDYDDFREWQLDKALRETKNDLEAGCYEITNNIEKHISELRHD